jgi:hypothetical protein
MDGGASGGMAAAAGPAAGMPGVGPAAAGVMVGAIAEKPCGSAVAAVLATGAGWPIGSGGGVGG